MLICCHVSAEFRDAHGQVLFRIPPSQRFSILEAPEEIRSDPLFDLLQSEGSLEAVQSVSRRKELENDPTRKPEAAGKRKNAKSPRAGEADEKPSSPAGEAASVPDEKAAPAGAEPEKP